MLKDILTFDDLKDILGYEDQRQIIACLTENKIQFRKGKRGRPWTTVHAVNSSMGITANQAEQQKIEF